MRLARISTSCAGCAGPRTGTRTRRRRHRASVSPGPDQPGEPPRDREQQLVADLVAVGVVDLLEPVEVGEQDRGVGVRPLRPQGGVLEPLLQQQPVGQPRQRVVQRVVVEPVGGLAGLLAGLGVEQVGGGDVGQGLRDVHVVRRPAPGSVAVEVECAESPVAVAQREGEHRGQTRPPPRRARTAGTGRRARGRAPRRPRPESNAVRHGPRRCSVCSRSIAQRRLRPKRRCSAVPSRRRSA